MPSQEAPRDFTGMKQDLGAGELIFDSDFESGNLDMVIKLNQTEYDLFMRVDTNTRGHHQWFYFSVSTNEAFKNKKVTFNVCNFTKPDSLYTCGMRIAVAKQSEDLDWHRGGENITYGRSHIVRRQSADITKVRWYSKLSFSYTFKGDNDKVFFAYCFPYTFTKLTRFIKTIMYNPINKDHVKEGVLCKSLSGLDVPLLTITSRVKSDPDYMLVRMNEFDDELSKLSLPLYKRKKVVIIGARVHPGESNGSWMMQGFIKYLIGDSHQAKQLRKRIVFKVVPMVNPDGVIIGNYRTSMAGNDLNRRYRDPNFRLHPTVVAIKKLAAGCIEQGEDILAFIDMHGHSRKKNVFVYGPEVPLHSDKYFKIRVIPKLLAEETDKFRYHSCRFRLEKCKERAARIVMWKEFNITNCFTFEASFYGYFNRDNQNFEFTSKSFEEMGEHLINSFYEFVMILEEDERRKRLRKLNMNKKKRELAGIGKQFSRQATLNAARGSSNFENSNRATPQLKDSDKAVHRKRNSIGGFNKNPNEPPEDTDPNEQDVEEVDNETQPVSPRNISKDKGTRNLIEMFDAVKLVDETANKEQDVLDDEPGTDNEEEPTQVVTEEDLDELTPEQQQMLQKDIMAVIKQFTQMNNITEQEYYGQTVISQQTSFKKPKKKMPVKTVPPLVSKPLPKVIEKKEERKDSISPSKRPLVKKHYDNVSGSGYQQNTLSIARKRRSTQMQEPQGQLANQVQQNFHLARQTQSTFPTQPSAGERMIDRYGSNFGGDAAIIMNRSLASANPRIPIESASTNVSLSPSKRGRIHPVSQPNMFKNNLVGPHHHPVLRQKQSFQRGNEHQNSSINSSQNNKLPRGDQKNPPRKMSQGLLSGVEGTSALPFAPPAMYIQPPEVPHEVSPQQSHRALEGEQLSVAPQVPHQTIIDLNGSVGTEKKSILTKKSRSSIKQKRIQEQFEKEYFNISKPANDLKPEIEIPIFTGKSLTNTVSRQVTQTTSPSPVPYLGPNVANYYRLTFNKQLKQSAQQKLIQNKKSSMFGQVNTVQGVAGDQIQELLAQQIANIQQQSTPINPKNNIQKTPNSPAGDNEMILVSHRLLSADNLPDMGRKTLGNGFGAIHLQPTGHNVKGPMTNTTMANWNSLQGSKPKKQTDLRRSFKIDDKGGKSPLFNLQPQSVDQQVARTASQNQFNYQQSNFSTYAANQFKDFDNEFVQGQSQLTTNSPKKAARERQESDNFVTPTIGGLTVFNTSQASLSNSQMDQRGQQHKASYAGEYQEMMSPQNTYHQATDNISRKHLKDPVLVSVDAERNNLPTRSSGLPTRPINKVFSLKNNKKRVELISPKINKQPHTESNQQAAILQGLAVLQTLDQSKDEMYFQKAGQGYFTRNQQSSQATQSQIQWSQVEQLHKSTQNRQQELINQFYSHFYETKRNPLLSDHSQYKRPDQLRHEQINSLASQTFQARGGSQKASLMQTQRQNVPISTAYTGYHEKQALQIKRIPQATQFQPARKAEDTKGQKK